MLGYIASTKELRDLHELYPLCADAAEQEERKRRLAEALANVVPGALLVHAVPGSRSTETTFVELPDYVAVKKWNSLVDAVNFAVSP